MKTWTATIEDAKWVRAAAEWWPVLLGLLILYAPTFFDLSRDLWNTDEYAHGPLILAVVAYLFWQKREVLRPYSVTVRPVVGGICLAIGLMLYMLGRSQEILMFEIGSLTPVLAGTLLVMRGWRGLRALRFAVVFALFMVPLPGVLVDSATAPLKQAISSIAENILYEIGYPVGRSGVMLSVGPYQMLVADACSGLYSMFSLSALGLLYLHVMRYRSRLRSGAIIASILPIAFVTNVARVIMLLLVTYHFGEQAGQGFMHECAGIFLFGVALCLLFGVDRLLGLWIPAERRRAA
jgi:exosortase B